MTFSVKSTIDLTSALDQLAEDLGDSELAVEYVAWRASALGLDAVSLLGPDAIAGVCAWRDCAPCPVAPAPVETLVDVENALVAIRWCR